MHLRVANTDFYTSCLALIMPIKIQLFTAVVNSSIYFQHIFDVLLAFIGKNIEGLGNGSVGKMLTVALGMTPCV